MNNAYKSSEEIIKLFIQNRLDDCWLPDGKMGKIILTRKQSAWLDKQLYFEGIDRGCYYSYPELKVGAQYEKRKVNNKNNNCINCILIFKI